jgi:hypothetical protein
VFVIAAAASDDSTVAASDASLDMIYILDIFDTHTAKRRNGSDIQRIGYK